MRLRPKVSSPLSHLPPVTAPHLGLFSRPALAQVPGCQLLPAWSTGAVDREQMASGTVHSCTAHIMSRGPGSGGQWHSCPSGSLSLQTLCPPHSSSGSLLPSPLPSSTLWWPLSFPLLSCTRGSSFCCSLCLLYMWLSSVSMSRSQAPFVSTSQSLGLSLFLLGHPQEQYSSNHRSRTQ